jgi:hypothetical protein
MPDEPKPKLIIDEDWKTKVQREKETLKHETSPSPAAESPAPGAPPVPGAGPLPPASFPILVTMLATQAMVALGVLHDPSQGEPKAEPDLAKHFIDLLGMLEAKTKGNLSAEENSLLSQTLHELRMMYVALTKAPS